MFFEFIEKVLCVLGILIFLCLVVLCRLLDIYFYVKRKVDEDEQSGEKSE